MQTRLALTLTGLAALIGSSSLAHAQVYPNLNGIPFTLSASATGDLSIGAEQGYWKSLDYSTTVTLQNGPVPTTTGTNIDLPALPFKFTATGGTVENVSGDLQLPAVQLGGQTVQLPAVQFIGTFNRNTGQLSGKLKGPSTPTDFSWIVDIARNGGETPVTLTATIAPNASVDLVGQASDHAGLLIISGSQVGPGKIDVTVSATVGGQPLFIPGGGPNCGASPSTTATEDITSFTLLDGPAAAVPEPSAAALAAPLAAGLLWLRRKARA
jgi:hypothetical protein